ncbi:MAG: diguanylate cyclase domain-containing protein [Symbiopectobacterium sp.]
MRSANELRNRRRFYHYIKDAVLRYHNVAIMMIDIDGFSDVNAAFWHAAGDEILCEIIHRLLTSTKETQIVARIGGDEFAVLLPDIYEQAKAGFYAKQIIAHIAQPNIKDAVLRYHNVAIMMIDIDGFSDVNAAFWHAAGDEILCEIIHRLLTSTKETQIVARIGGDEFAVLLPDIYEQAKAGFYAKQIIAHIAQPILVQGNPISITVSRTFNWHRNTAMKPL